MSTPRQGGESKGPIVSETGVLQIESSDTQGNGRNSTPSTNSNEQFLEAKDETEAFRLIGEKDFRWDYKSNKEQATALHLAVEKGWKDIVTALAQKYGDAVDACDKYGRTPLHCVAGRPNAGQVTRVLLKNGANIDALDNQNLTPLHRVVYLLGWLATPECDSKSRIVRQLLRNGAEVNTRDIFGDSPLHDAAKNGDKGIVKQLLESGADRECRNFDGHTPRDLTQSREIEDELDKGPSSVGDLHPTPPIPSKAPRCWGRVSSTTSGGSDGKTPDGNQDKVCSKFFASARFFTRDRQYSKSWSVSVHDLLHDRAQSENDIKRLEKRFVADFEKTEGFQMKEKCWKWIHIPVNQMSWVTELVWRLTEDDEDNCSDDNGSEDNGSEDNGSGPNDNQPEIRQEAWKFLDRNVAQRKGGKPGIFIRVPHAGDLSRNRGTSQETSQETNQRTDEKTDEKSLAESPQDPESSMDANAASLYRREIWRSKAEFPLADKISIVVPYIDFETEQYLQRYDMLDGRYKIRTARIRDKCKLEEMSRPYRGLMGLHKSQTLDESHYDMLKKDELRARDEDQVVSRWYRGWDKKSRQGKGHRAQDQAPSTDPTQTAKPQSTTELKEVEELKSKHLKYRRVDRGLRDFGEDTQRASKLPRLLMVHQLWLWKLDEDTIITAFPDRYHQGVEDSLFETIRQGDIGSYTDPHQLIANIVFEATTFLEEFRYAGLGTHVLDIFESSIAKYSHQEAIRFQDFSRSLEKDDREENEISHEIKLIDRCKDIRDELHLLLRVFEAQKSVVGKFADLFWRTESASKLKKAFIQDCGVGNLIERTKELDGHAQRTLQELDYLVQTEQAQAALDEAQTAGQLNKVIWLFTLVTVIFTPLSFMTSLFAIPFNYFPQNSEGEIRVAGAWIADRMAIGEVVSVVTIAVLAVLFRTPRFERMWKHVWRYVWWKVARLGRRCYTSLSSLSPSEFFAREKRPGDEEKQE